MNYEESREYIKTLYDEKRIILGLERVLTLMSLVGNPHEKYQCAIVTGTNGKGSTSLYLSSIVKAAGYKVGTNMSPHVQDITERFLIDLEKIDHNRFSEIATVFRDVIDKKWPAGVEHPTFHELMTGMAFYLFAEEKVDFAVMEVGMGGRYDACNIVDNKLSIFTPIHFDHCRYLGNSLQAIAFEKAHIMKSGGAAVSAPQSPQVRQVLTDVASKFNTHLQFLDIRRFTRLEGELLEPVKFRYRFNESTEEDLSLALCGHYQVHNASLAIMASEKLSELNIIEGFSRKFDCNVVKNGLNAVVSKHLPARLELVGTNPAFVIDGGHNVHGLRCFMNELRQHKNTGKVILVMGFKEGKNYFDILPLIDKPINRIIFTNFETYGGVPPEQLKTEFMKVHPENQVVVDTYNDPDDAINAAFKLIENVENDIVAVAGSLYLAGEIKNRYSLKVN